jgi:hypothetical protein
VVSVGSIRSVVSAKLLYLQQTESKLIAGIDGGSNVVRGCVGETKCSGENTHLILPYTAGSIQHASRVTVRRGM